MPESPLECLVLFCGVMVLRGFLTLPDKPGDITDPLRFLDDDLSDLWLDLEPGVPGVTERLPELLGVKERGVLCGDTLGDGVTA